MYFLNQKLLLQLAKRSLLIKGNFSSSRNIYYLNLLSKRTLLRLKGPDTYNYLQSMMTNDVRKTQDFSSLYALFLNPNGRVLYDIILYKINESEYFVEYDSSGVEYFNRHLLMYRLRKDVKIQIMTDKSIWAIYKHENLNENKNFTKTVTEHLKSLEDVITCTEDPRNSLLGIRIITNKNVDLYGLLKLTSPLNFVKGDSYRLHRYKLGIGEGVIDHPPGNCLPFETNVDLLNGVSFTKGCYIGQEMTAKSNFVFSIRKRLMPVIFEKLETYPVFPPECNVINDKGQKVGRLRSHLEEHGLALLKFDECVKSKHLEFEGYKIKLEAIRPKWWPSNLKSEANEHLYS